MMEAEPVPETLEIRSILTELLDKEILIALGRGGRIRLCPQVVLDILHCLSS
jgi:hypothetical protein